MSGGKELRSSFCVPSREVIPIFRRSRLSSSQPEGKNHSGQNQSFASNPNKQSLGENLFLFTSFPVPGTRKKGVAFLLTMIESGGSNEIAGKRG